MCARAGWTLADFAAACLDGGATLLQIRAKTLSSDALLRAADAIVQRAASSSATVIVNDRADVARLSGAAGVHVGQDDLPPRAVRRLLGDAAIVGLSTHTLAQLDAAVVEPITYVAVGPVFGTRTKDTGYAAVGLEMVREAAARAAQRRLPVAAIGGITLEKAPELITAGASTVAVITDLFTGSSPSARVRAYVDRLGRV